MQRNMLLNQLTRLNQQMAGTQRSNRLHFNQNSPLPSNFFLIFDSRDHERAKLHRFIEILHGGSENFTISVALRGYYGGMGLGLVLGLSGEVSCDINCDVITKHGFSKIIQLMDNWRKEEFYWSVIWKPCRMPIGVAARLDTLDGAIEWLTKTNRRDSI